MTMIVAINTGDAAIVAADRRQIFKVDGHLSYIDNDNTNKFVKWNGGYITGCGYVALLNELKDRMAQTEICNTNKILDLIQEIENSSSVPEAAKRETHWLFTYLTQEKGNVVCRVAVLDPGQTDGFRVLNNGACTIWLSHPNLDELIKQINSLVKPFSSFPDINNALIYYQYLLEKLFEHGAYAEESVCKEHDIVIAYDGGYETIFAD